MRKMIPVLLTLCLAMAAFAGEEVPEGEKPARAPDEFGGKFPRTMRDCALPREKLPKVLPDHPRLLIRAKPSERWMSVEQLRVRAKQDPWAGRF